jgi:predicted O-linked N-acetylglucosamine transferase (SPINDLY family)
LPAFSSVLEKEITILQKRNDLLEKVIKVLYKQNLQYVTALNQYKVTEKELKRGLERSQKAATDVHTLFRQSQSKMRKTEKLALEDWQDYCDEKTYECRDTIGRYLEKIKQRLLEKDYKEIVIGMRDNHEPTK